MAAPWADRFASVAGWPAGMGLSLLRAETGGFMKLGNCYICGAHTPHWVKWSNWSGVEHWFCDNDCLARWLGRLEDEALNIVREFSKRTAVRSWPRSSTRPVVRQPMDRYDERPIKTTLPAVAAI